MIAGIDPGGAVAERTVALARFRPRGSPGPVGPHGSAKVDDRDVLKRTLRWIDDEPRDRPFFAMMWTYQGHYPHYSVAPATEWEPGRRNFNRYLTAVQEDDRMIGDLVRELTARGLLDSTLIVITGDHGQTFAQSASVRATRDLTEQSVRVPLVFLNPHLVEHPGVDTGLARHIDIGPSILDLLSIDVPREWQGSSLFSGERTNRLYFTSSYKAPTLYGLREGQFKFITDGDTPRLYDLAADPDEAWNVAGAHPDLVSDYNQSLVAWHRYQPTYLERFAPR